MYREIFRILGVLENLKNNGHVFNIFDLPTFDYELLNALNRLYLPLSVYMNREQQKDVKNISRFKKQLALMKKVYYLFLTLFFIKAYYPLIFSIIVA